LAYCKAYFLAVEGRWKDMLSKKSILIVLFILMVSALGYWGLRFFSSEDKFTTQDMVYIPAGKFIMGTDDEEPRILKNPHGFATKFQEPRKKRVIDLKGFYMDKYEVTNRQYRRFVDEAGYRLPDHWQQTSTYPEGENDYPVTFITWWDAKAYCKWAGQRLPTEEEWEKAARGTDGREFPWGKQFDKTKANTWEADVKKIHAVGKYEAGKSPYGVYDVAGNVMEWTGSEYRQYQHSPEEKDGNGEGIWYTMAVLRGGAWSSDKNDAQTFSRVMSEPGIKSNGIGFRCAKDE
jgi:formylglycine-generating enzyme required for sulfatase activity